MTAGIAAMLGRRAYYGWVVVGTLALTETVSWGIIYYAFSVFLVPMRDELGWSEPQMTGAYSVALLLSGLAAPFVGRWIDRRGPRAIMTAGSVLGVVLLLAWSRVGNLAGYYLIWAGLGLAMSATLYEPAFTTLTAWFEKKRASAFLYMTIAAGFASTIFLPLSGWFVDIFGWRDALVALALILAILTVPPHALLLRRRPEDLGLRPDGVPDTATEPDRAPRPLPPGRELGEALRDPAFWWLAVAFSLETFATVAVAVYMIPYLTDRGDGAAFAAAATGLIGAAQVAARILATALGDRVSQIAITTFVFALQAVSVIVLLQWESKLGVLVAVLMLGMGRGVITLMRASLIADFYGRRHYGAINGTLAFFLTGARSAAPVAAGIWISASGGYRPFLWGMVIVSALGAVAMRGVRRSKPVAVAAA